MSRFRWCKLHREAYHEKCPVCCPPPEKIIIVEEIVSVFDKHTPDHSNLPSIEIVMATPRVDWCETYWMAWRVYNASKNVP